MSDYISRSDAIEAVLTYFIPRSHTGERGEHEEDFVRTIFKALPSADAVHGEDNEIIKAIHTINNFLDTQGVFLATSMWRAKDGTILSCDWGYFDEGMREIEKYLKGGAK